MKLAHLEEYLNKEITTHKWKVQYAPNYDAFFIVCIDKEGYSVSFPINSWEIEKLVDVKNMTWLAIIASGLMMQLNMRGKLG